MSQPWSYFYIGLYENEREIRCLVTDEHRQRAAEEIISDDPQDIMDDLDAFLYHLFWEGDRKQHAAIVRKIRDELPEFQAWREKHYAERVNNRAFDIAAEDGERKYYERKMDGPDE